MMRITSSSLQFNITLVFNCPRNIRLRLPLGHWAQETSKSCLQDAATTQGFSPLGSSGPMAANPSHPDAPASEGGREVVATGGDSEQLQGAQVRTVPIVDSAQSSSRQSNRSATQAQSGQGPLWGTRVTCKR